MNGLIFSGILQGLVLGNMLFDIFINDLEVNIKPLLIKFMDDKDLVEWRLITQNSYTEQLESLGNLGWLKQNTKKVAKGKTLQAAWTEWRTVSWNAVIQKN